MFDRRLLRAVTAGVWLHQGLWCKVLGRDPHHQAIVGSLPQVGPTAARRLTQVIGAGETALAAVVALRGSRRSVALAQLGLVTGMNLGGLLAGRRHIPRPGRLLARNAAFAVVVWGAVDAR